MAIIKELIFPDFSNLDLHKEYGNCYFCIKGETLFNPPKISARCFFERKYFPNTERGYKQAIKWLLEQRLFCLKKLYVEDDNQT